jgi:hypothetical protein
MMMVVVEEMIKWLIATVQALGSYLPPSSSSPSSTMATPLLQDFPELSDLS